MRLPRDFIISLNSIQVYFRQQYCYIIQLIMMRIIEFLLITILLYYHVSQQKRCGRLFPIELGGKNKANFGNQLDYHAGTGQLAVAADTIDEKFAGSANSFFNFRGYIAVLKEPAMDIVWIKTVSLICFIQGLTFSTDGQLILSHTSEASSHFMFIFNALDGTLRKSFSYGQNQQSYLYLLYTRNILFGSPVSGTYTGFAHTRRMSSSDQIEGFQTFAFTFDSTSALSILWQRLTYYSVDNPYAIVFSHTQSFLYAFSKIKSTDYVLARLNALTGAINWQYYFNPTSSQSVNQISSTLARKTLADSVNEVIVAHRGSAGQRPIYVRIVADFTTGTVSMTTPPKTYIDSASPLAQGMRATGQFIIDQDQTVFLLLKSSQTYFGLLNFGTLTASYKRALPTLDTDYLGMSVMKSDTMFYAISQGIRVGVSSTASTWISFGTQQPILLSTDLDESCYTVYTEAYTSYSLSNHVNVNPLTSYNYFSITAFTGVTLTVYSTITTFSNDITEMQDVSSWCPLYTSPYAIQSVTQVQSTFYYTVGSSASFSITPYSSSFFCGSIAPVFTYTGFYNTNGVALVPADFIQIAPTNGQITVTTASALTNTAIKIEGVLQDVTHKWTQVFILTGNPSMYPNLATTPQNQIIPVFKISTMNIGTVNPFPGGTASVNVQLAGGGTPSAFITFAAPIVSFNSPGYAQIGVYNLEIKVLDSSSNQVYPFTLTVKNYPPVFTQPAPVRIEAYSSVKTQYTLPTFQDPEFQPCTVSIFTGPSFISIQGGQLNIYSTNIAEIMEHDVTIKLEDTQPLSTQYTFKVAILNRGPELTGIFENKTVPLNNFVNYQLPVRDPENQPLNIVLEALQSVKDFITIGSGALQFSPTLISHIGTFSIGVKIADSFGSEIENSFWITVTNTPPFFIDSGPTTQVISINRQTIYGLPPFSDVEQTVQVIATSMPSFASLTADKMFSFSPTVTDFGSYTIDGYLSDGILQTPFTFQLQVTNKAPFFLSKLKDLQIKVKERANYTLPDPRDDEYQVVVIKTNLLGSLFLPSFMTFDDANLIYNLYPVSNQDAGKFDIQVSLTDNLAYPTLYQFKVEVLAIPEPPAPIVKIVVNNTVPKKVERASQFKPEIKQQQSLKKNQKTEIQGLLTIKEVTRDGRMTLKVQPYQGVNLTQQIINSTLIMVISSRDDEVVPFNITGRDKDTGEIHVQLYFVAPMNISNNVKGDIIEVILAQRIASETTKLYSYLERGQYAQKLIPAQINQLQQKIVANIKSGRIQIFKSQAGNFIASLFIQYVWGYLHDVSFLTINTLISMPSPGIAQLIQQVFLNLIYVDLLWTEFWLPQIFESDEAQLVDEDEGINEFFDENGFQSKLLIKNLGSTFVFLVIYLFLIMISLALRVASLQFTFAKYLSDKLSSSLFWNRSLSFFHSQFPPLMIASIINIKHLSYETPISATSSCFSIGIIVALPLCYGLEVYVIRKYKNCLDNKEFEEKYGATVEGQNLSSNVGRYWQPITLMRWTLTNVILVQLRENYIAQIITFLILSVIAQILIISSRPFKTALDNRMNLGIEVCVSLYLYVQLALTDFMGDMTLRDELGCLMASIIILVVGVNVLVLFSTVLSNLAKFIKKLFIKHLRGSQETVQIKPEIKSKQSFFSQPDLLVVEDITQADGAQPSECSDQQEEYKVEAHGGQSDSRSAEQYLTDEQMRTNERRKAMPSYHRRHLLPSDYADANSHMNQKQFFY